VPTVSRRRQAIPHADVDAKSMLNHNGVLAMDALYDERSIHLTHRTDRKDVDGTETNHTI
jgi:hypothetical protein